jgi:hypothetical protein
MNVENLLAPTDGKAVLPRRGRGTMRSMVEGYQRFHARGCSGHTPRLTPLRRADARHLPFQGRILSGISLEGSVG